MIAEAAIFPQLATAMLLASVVSAVLGMTRVFVLALSVTLVATGAILMSSPSSGIGEAAEADALPVHVVDTIAPAN